MKVKCPHCDGEGWYVVPDHNGEAAQEQCHNCYASGFMEVSIPTSDIIAEFKTRKPCAKCDYPRDIGNACAFGDCLWHNSLSEDDFKPSSERGE